MTDNSGMPEPEPETDNSGMPEPEPEKMDNSSQPLAAGSKPHLSYKSLLNQYAQKLRIQLPMYQTHNEGAEHLPQFRSTVWIDGVSYTSSNTFQQRKMAEMDVSKIAFFATMHKLKNEAAHFILEDKAFCKSILVEYAARMNIEKPTYQTIRLDTSVPGFRSSLVFNGITYTGDSGKSKKEAEQLAARAIILKYLDSESGNVMSEIINCKFRHYAEMNKVKETNNAHDGTNVVAAQTGFDDDITLNKAKAEAETNYMPKPSAIQEPRLLQGTTIPATCLSPGITPTPNPDVSVHATIPAVPEPTVLAQTPFAGINNSSTSSTISAPGLGQFAGIPGTHPSSIVIQPANSEASPWTVVTPLPLAAPASEHMQLAGPTSGKKRSRKSKKNAQKKMRADAQMLVPVVPTSEAPPCSAQ